MDLQVAFDLFERGSKKKGIRQKNKKNQVTQEAL